jgi:hypothetical protein
MMVTGKNGAAHALFQKVGTDGTRFVFMVSDEQWMITRNGKQVACGTVASASIDSGVRKFRSIAAAVRSLGSVREEDATLQQSAS